MNSFSPASIQAMETLRSAAGFQWYVVPLLALVVYLYCVEIGRKNWNGAAAGLACLGFDFIGEIANALILRFSQFAPLWNEPGPTVFRILVGINIETALMFSIYGLAVAKVLPENKRLKVWGLPNRWLVVAGFAVFCMIIELLLNACGALVWDYAWWGRNLWSVIFFAYGPLTAFVVWIHDLKSQRLKWRLIAAIYLFDAVVFYVLAMRLRLI